MSSVVSQMKPATTQEGMCTGVCVCVCVCVCARASVCVCVRERERESKLMLAHMEKKEEKISCKKAPSLLVSLDHTCCQFLERQQSWHSTYSPPSGDRYGLSLNPHGATVLSHQVFC